MREIYLKQINEGYDYFYNEQKAIKDKVYIGGNRKLKELNKSLIDQIESILDYCRKYYEDYTNINPIVLHKFDSLCGNGVVLDDDDYLDLYEYVKCSYLVDDLMYCNTQYFGKKNEIISNILSVLYGEPFVTGVIIKDGSGEWNNYICPELLEQFLLNVIAPIYFKTSLLLKATIVEDIILNGNIELIEDLIDHSSSFPVCFHDINKDDIVSQNNITEHVSTIKWRLAKYNSICSIFRCDDVHVILNGVLY